MRKTIVTMMLVVVGCGGSTAPEPQAAGGDAGETCAGHRATDACMNEESFAQCRAREAECPGEVLQLESCPLQFACP